jgi:uncharacterized protein (UPF0335 family)
MSDEISGNQLLALVERIERLTEEKKSLNEDIKEVFAEAKSNGFDPKIIKQIIKIRSQDRNELEEQEVLLDLYMSALSKAN